MPVRVRYKVEVAISSSTAEERDLGNGKFEVVVDSLNEGGSWKTVVAGGASNQQIQLPNVASAQFLAIRTSPKNPNDPAVALTFTKNSPTGEAIVVAPLSGSKEGYFLFTTSTLTSLYCSNAGSTATAVQIYVGGD